MQPISLDECVAFVRTLPQSDHINDDTIQTWFSAVSKNDPNRMQWHLDRLRGIGGFEIGTVVAELAGRASPFPDANINRIVSAKLMKVAPYLPNADMQRGNLYEPFARDHFLRTFGVEALIISNVSEAQRAADGVPFWLRVNMDDVVMNAAGAIGVVDYKSPAKVKETVAFEYRAQLHYGALAISAGAVRLSRGDNTNVVEKGRMADFMALVQWDALRVSTKPIHVPYSREIADSLVENAVRVWGMVCSGVIPPQPKASDKKITVASSDLSDALTRNAAALAALRTLKKLITEQDEAIVEQMSDSVQGITVPTDDTVSIQEPTAAGTWKLSPGAIDVAAVYALLPPDVQAKTEAIVDYDVNALVEMCKQLGGKPEQAAYRAIDNGLVIEQAKLHGFDLEGFRHKGTLEFAMTSAKKGPNAEAKAVEGIRAQEAFSGVCKALAITQGAVPGAVVEGEPDDGLSP